MIRFNMIQSALYDFLFPTFLSTALLLVPATVRADVSATVFPGMSWETMPPAEAGLSAVKLRAVSDYIGGRGCVVRYGRMVYSWGDVSERGDVASAAKPVYSHFLFKALEDGRIPGLDQRLVEWEPRLAELNPARGNKDRNISWRHVANQVSCYGVSEYPGTAFCYNDWQMALFWDTLFTGVYGATRDNVDETVLRPLLADPLGCEDEPSFMAFGTDDRPGRLRISVRDFARFGLLYLQGGNWNGRQLIAPEHARMAVTSSLPNTIPQSAGIESAMIEGQRTIGSKRIPDNQADHDGGYSWLWWTNGIDRAGHPCMPGVPPDTYGAFGHGARRAMAVIPSLDLIVSWNDSNIEGNDMRNEALRLLAGAVNGFRPPSEADERSRAAGITPKETVTVRPPLHPADNHIAVYPDHPSRFVRADGRAYFMAGPGDPEGFLYRGALNPDGTRTGDQDALIAKLAGTGANCIYLMAVRSHGGDGDETQNPFVDNDPSKGVNMRVLDQWEGWFDAMDRHDIAIYLFLYDDSALVWDTGDRVGEEERAFVTTLVDRFEHHDDLVWCIAEEYQEKLSQERVSNVAILIKNTDDRDHPVAVHKLHGLDFSEFADDPAIDQFAVQYNVGTPDSLHAGMVSAWKAAGGRYSITMAEAADHGTGKVARLKSWACAMAGAYVMVLGMDIAGTPVSDLEDCGRIVDFFQSVDFYGLEPADDLGFGDTRYVLADPERRYIAYSPDTKDGLGIRGMTAGVYDALWFDCVTGRRVRKDGVRIPGGDRLWEKPEGMGKEAALYLERKGSR